MNTFIDILCRLIIATITFVGPTMIFTFGILYDAIIIDSRERESKQNEIANQAARDLNISGADKVKVLEDHVKKFSAEKKLSKKLKNFFTDPKIQIIIVFLLLFFSLGSLMFSYLVKDNTWNMQTENPNLWCRLIWTTCITYFLSVVQIVFFIMNVVNIKIKVEGNKTK